MNTKDDKTKKEVNAFWQSSPCGTYLATAKEGTKKYFKEIEHLRYFERPYKYDFLLNIFKGLELKNKKVLEIGCGAGTDSVKMASLGGLVTATDLTKAAVKLTNTRFKMMGVRGRAIQADAENLPFKNESMDIVYSFGVLHHTPKTQAAIDEVRRVLKENGRAVIGLYHRHSINYLKLCFKATVWPYLWKLSWKQRLNLLTETNKDINGPTNPLTKMYTEDEVRKMFKKFSEVKIRKYWSNVWSLPGFVERFLGQHWGWYIIVEASK